MMFNYPYIGYPFSSNRYLQNNNYLNNQLSNRKSYPSPVQNASHSSFYADSNSKKQTETKKEEMKKENSLSKDYIEILGIKLHFDDIILILLIYFLYTEGVDDFYLFIILILLLLT